MGAVNNKESGKVPISEAKSDYQQKLQALSKEFLEGVVNDSESIPEVETILEDIDSPIGSENSEDSHFEQFTRNTQMSDPGVKPKTLLNMPVKKPGLSSVTHGFKDFCWQLKNKEFRHNLMKDLKSVYKEKNAISHINPNTLESLSVFSMVVGFFTIFIGFFRIYQQNVEVIAFGALVKVLLASLSPLIIAYGGFHLYRKENKPRVFWLFYHSISYLMVALVLTLSSMVDVYSSIFLFHSLIAFSVWNWGTKEGNQLVFSFSPLKLAIYTTMLNISTFLVIHNLLSF